MRTSTRAATLKTGSLLFDPKNTRIPANRRSNDQRRLLHELLEHEDVKGLASSITKLGLFPNERLVVVSSGKRFVVLEGNRRLAAIKLLLNPELAPTDAQVKYFRRLSSRTDIPSLGKVEVSIVESRIAAAPLIAALHTKESKRRWTSLQQARFYSELTDEGQTPAEIAEDVGLTVGQVRDYLRAEKLHRLALTLDYDDEIRRKIDDPKYPLTTLQRFIESKTGRKFLGVELDDEKGLRGVVHPDRFKATLSRVAEDIATYSGMTRKINNEDGFKAYIEEASGKIPRTRVRGSFDPDVLLGEKTPEDNTEKQEEPQKTKRSTPTRQSSSVIPKGFPCNTKNPRVQEIYTELQRLKVITHRNSTAVMLRVLLDIALWDFFKKEGHAKAVCNYYDRTRKRRRHDPDWTPPLRDLISYAVEKRIFTGMTADGYKAIRSLAARDSTYFITVDGFNQFTHNAYTTPTEGDLRALWQRAEPMLEVILNTDT